MSEERHTYYAVYLFPNAVETLGEAIKPFLRESVSGQHIVCSEIDAGGGLFEMTIPGHDANGKPVECEVMLPAAMVKLVVSMRRDTDIGFT